MVEEGFCGRGVACEEGDASVEKTELVDEGTTDEACAACEEDVAVGKSGTEGRVEEGRGGSGMGHCGGGGSEMRKRVGRGGCWMRGMEGG